MKRTLLVGVLYLLASAGLVAQSQSAQQAKEVSTSTTGAKALFYHEGRVVEGPGAANAPAQPSRPATAAGKPQGNSSAVKTRPVSVAATVEKAPSVGVHYWIELDVAAPVTAHRT